MENLSLFIWKFNSLQYIHKKIQKYQRMINNGTLTEPRLSAFEKYMEMTEGGTNIEF